MRTGQFILFVPRKFHYRRVIKCIGIAPIQNGRRIKAPTVEADTPQPGCVAKRARSRSGKRDALPIMVNRSNGSIGQAPKM